MFVITKNAMNDCKWQEMITDDREWRKNVYNSKQWLSNDFEMTELWLYTNQ